MSDTSGQRVNRAPTHPPGIHFETIDSLVALYDGWNEPEPGNNFYQEIFCPTSIARADNND